MEQSGICNPPKNNFKYEKFFQKHIFDEDFLDEKDKALSPILLSDEIPGEITKKSLKENEEKEINLKLNEEKDIKYGSNIVYIDSKIDDNDEEYNEIMNEQINMIVIQQINKKFPIGRKMRKKSINFY